MSGRYLAVVAPYCDPAALAKRLAKVGDFRCVRDVAGLVLFAEPRLRPLSLGEGALLGPLFARGDTEPQTALDRARQEAVIASDGRILTESYWGNYVAFLSDPRTRRLDVVRAPFGALAALWARSGDALLIASDVALLRIGGLPTPGVDWAALGLHLLQPELRRPATCLAGVSEITGGWRARFVGNAVTHTETWSPWTYAGRPSLAPDDAPARLRDAVLVSVQASTAPYGRTTLLLSGGLDSSLVAAALKAGRRATACLTFRTAGAGGDESAYARSVADHLGLAWHEVRPDPANIDLARSGGAHLPRPSERAFFQDYDRAAIAFARAQGATAIVDGGGGDNLFYAHPAAAPVADALITGNGRFWSSAQALADLTGASLWRVAGLAARRAWRGRSATGATRARTQLLSPALAAKARIATLHPWYAPPASILPGKASHVALLAPAQGLVEASDPTRAIPNISALLTQPLVETCLRVATDLWFAPGRNRALARGAFGDALPAAVLARRSKGTPDAFLASLYDARRNVIRNLLLDGALAAHGLLDCAAVRAMLDDPAPAKGHGFARMLELVDAEAWARAWS